MKKILLLIVFILLLSGCADYKEVNDLDIVNAIGIDYQDDEFILTFEVYNDKVDKDSAKITTYTRTATDKSLAVALERTADLLSGRAYYSHIALCIISPEVAKHHIQEVADFFIRSTYLRENFPIVISSNYSPEDMLNIKTEENPIPSTAITKLLETNGYASDYAVKKTFDIFFGEILDFGKDTAISTVAVQDNNFYIDGLSLFDNYQMVQTLDKEKASIYNLLRNESVKPVFNLEYEGTSFTISIYDNSTKFDVTSDKIKVKGEYKAKIMNNVPNFNVKNEKVLKELNENFSKLLKEKIEEFIKITQEAHSDSLYLADAYYKSTRDKNDLLWDHAEIESDIKVTINKKGLIFNIYEDNK